MIIDDATGHSHMIHMCWYDEKADRFILHAFDAGISSITLTLTREQIVRLAREIQEAQEKQLAQEKQYALLGEQHEHRISQD